MWPDLYDSNMCIVFVAYLIFCACRLSHVFYKTVAVYPNKRARYYMILASLFPTILQNKIAFYIYLSVCLPIPIQHGHWKKQRNLFLIQINWKGLIGQLSFKVRQCRRLKWNKLTGFALFVDIISANNVLFSIVKWNLMSTTS